MEVRSAKIDFDSVLYPAIIKALTEFKLDITTDFSKISNQEEAELLTAATLKQLQPRLQATLESSFSKAISTSQLAEWGAYYVAHQTHKNTRNQS